MPFNKLEHHLLGVVRPRFRLETDLSKEEVFERIKTHLEKDESVEGMVSKLYGIIKIPHDKAHYWSPELQVRPDYDEYFPDREETVIRCLLGPKQSVWVLFVFFYSLIGVLCFFGGMYGLSEMLIDKSSWMIWLFPIGLILISSLWLIARIGQSKGRDEMLHLVSFLYHALDGNGNLRRV